MRPLFSLSMLLLVSGAALATEPGTALDALKRLPRGQAKLLARIEAREGTPVPERWHILVYDKEARNGVREYVVAKGQVITSRTLSQFAETLAQDQVIGDQSGNVDSDRGAKLLQQYALANNLTVTALNYELKKDGLDAVALWRITGLDEAGNEVGTLVLASAKGDVISHEGFPIEPSTAQVKKAVAKMGIEGGLKPQPKPEGVESPGEGEKATRKNRPDKPRTEESQPTVSQATESQLNKPRSDEPRSTEAQGNRTIVTRTVVTRTTDSQPSKPRSEESRPTESRPKSIEPQPIEVRRAEAVTPPAGATPRKLFNGLNLFKN